MQWPTWCGCGQRRGWGKVGVIVSRVDASLHMGWNFGYTAALNVYLGVARIERTTTLGTPTWKLYYMSGLLSAFNDDGSDGVCSIECAIVDGELQYTYTTPAGSDTRTAIGTDGPSEVRVIVGGYTDYYPISWVHYVNVTHGVLTEYPWDDIAELDDWTATNITVSGGVLITDAVQGQLAASIRQIFAYQAPSGKALTSVLSAPGIQRIVAVSSANVLQDRYASGSLADILTSGITDNHPELVHVGAGGHHLGLVWQRSNDICITTGTGVPGAGGWPNTVQTVALSRSKPTACVIDPTHDLGVAYIQGSNALFAPASWANGSYVMGTETLISSGDVADERGQLLQAPDGYLIYVYRDTTGAVALKRSANRGQSWS